MYACFLFASIKSSCVFFTRKRTSVNPKQTANTKSQRIDSKKSVLKRHPYLPFIATRRNADCNGQKATLFVSYRSAPLYHIRIFMLVLSVIVQSSFAFIFCCTFVCFQRIGFIDTLMLCVPIINLFDIFCVAAHNDQRAKHIDPRK